MELITFQPRWREELVAKSSNGILVFELTMGTPHVYFPDQECWKKEVPNWALPLWEEYKNAAEKWCVANRTPISIVDNALVYAEKPV